MKNRTTLLDKLRDHGIEMTTTEELLDLSQSQSWRYSEKYLKAFLANSTGNNNSGYRTCTTHIEDKMYQVHFI